MATTLLSHQPFEWANVDPLTYEQKRVRELLHLNKAVILGIRQSYHWLRGERVVSEVAEELGRELDTLDEINELPIDHYIKIEAEEKGGKQEYRTRIRRRTPFVIHVVRHLRGTELGQLTYTEANKLHVDRAARDFAKSINMRSTDFADALPLVIATYFFKPSQAQIEANEIVHSSAFVDAIKSYQATFVGRSGRNPLKITA